MIIGGLFAAGFIGENAWFTQIPWQWALSSFAVVVLVYAVMVLPEKFPETVGESSGNFATVFSCFVSIPFLVLIVLHALVGYMELGVDSWMTKLCLPSKTLLPIVYIAVGQTLWGCALNGINGADQPASANPQTTPTPTDQQARAQFHFTGCMD